MFDVLVRKTGREGGGLDLDVGGLWDDLRAVDQPPLIMTEDGKLLERCLEVPLELGLVVDKGLPFASGPLVTSELLYSLVSSL